MISLAIAVHEMCMQLRNIWEMLHLYYIEFEQKLLTRWMLYTHLCNFFQTCKDFARMRDCCMHNYVYTTVALFYIQENAMYN